VQRVALLVAASLVFSAAASSPVLGRTDAGARAGGTLRVDLTGDFDYIDSSLSYFQSSWQLHNATQLKLMSFPDRDGDAGMRMRPEAASSVTVSRDKRTYTFTIKRGFKFNDGTDVTAANFRAAILRAMNPAMNSRARRHLTDVRSVTTPSRYSLRIRLSKAAPDFVTRMTMPFFAAIPVNRPIDPNGVGAPLVSAGPYFVREWIRGRSAVAVRNPHWNNSRAPWRGLRRPAYADQIVWTMNQPLATTHARILGNQTDIGIVSNQFASDYARDFGINRNRYFVRKTLNVFGASLNTRGALFSNNPPLRQAVNFAIPRDDIARLIGPHAVDPGTGQILPPGMPGVSSRSIYPRNVARAQQLARGNTRSGRAVYYTFNTPPGPQIAEIVRFNLRQIGIETEIRQFPPAEYDRRIGTRGEPFDISHSGWGADYPDPYNFINILLDGRRIQATNNTNRSYFNDAGYNRRMDQAARLSGPARLRAYSNLDVDIMRNQAPLAPYFNFNSRIIVGPDVGCYTFAMVYSTPNLAAICKN
jgi:peptide/nickel transport system substrate-binding protein